MGLLVTRLAGSTALRAEAAAVVAMECAEHSSGTEAQILFEAAALMAEATKLLAAVATGKKVGGSGRAAVLELLGKKAA